MIQTVAEGVKLGLILGAVIAALALSPTASSQVASSLNDPAVTIRDFKTSLDANDISSMCSLMAERDSSGPLSPLHFEKMQSSMSELVKLWQYKFFSFNGTTIDNSETPPRAMVQVAISQPKQEVKFTLLKFPSGWYICDIEIYFK